jgi:hypothetical protein
LSPDKKKWFKEELKKLPIHQIKFLKHAQENMKIMFDHEEMGLKLNIY